jgi:hypothetical protein
MTRIMRTFFTVSIAGLFALVATAPVSAQQKAGGMVCWKDKSGKTIGCGDKVPPEYQDNASSVVNKRGVTVNQTDAALTPEQRKAQAAEAEHKKAAALKAEEEKRKDRALLDSFTNEKEIDLKRTRDIQQIEVSISTHQSQIKNLTDRQNDAKAKIDPLKKDNKPVPPALQQEHDKLAADIARTQEQIAQKRKEIAEKNVEYDAMKKRFIELKNQSAAPAKK